jgi:hypothetical protein
MRSAATSKAPDLNAGTHWMEFTNTAPWDRLVRLLIGASMLVLGWYGPEGFATLSLRVLALYPLFTAIAGWCPIYALLRTGTRRPQSR